MTGTRPRPPRLASGAPSHGLERTCRWTSWRRRSPTRSGRSSPRTSATSRARYSPSSTSPRSSRGPCSPATRARRSPCGGCSSTSSPKDLRATSARPSRRASPAPSGPSRSTTGPASSTGTTPVAQLGRGPSRRATAAQPLDQGTQWGRLSGLPRAVDPLHPVRRPAGGRSGYHVPDELAAHRSSAWRRGDARPRVRHLLRVASTMRLSTGALPRSRGLGRRRTGRATIRAKAFDSWRGLCPRPPGRRRDLWHRQGTALLLRMRAHPLRRGALLRRSSMLDRARQGHPATSSGAASRSRRRVGRLPCRTRVAAAACRGIGSGGRGARVRAAVHAHRLRPGRRGEGGGRRALRRPGPAGRPAPRHGQEALGRRTGLGARRGGGQPAHSPVAAFERTSVPVRRPVRLRRRFRDLQRHRRARPSTWQRLSPVSRFRDSPPTWRRPGQAASTRGHDPLRRALRADRRGGARDVASVRGLDGVPHPVHDGDGRSNGPPAAWPGDAPAHRHFAGHAAIAGAMAFVDHGDVDLERLEAERRTRGAAPLGNFVSEDSDGLRRQPRTRPFAELRSLSFLSVTFRRDALGEGPRRRLSSPGGSARPDVADAGEVRLHPRDGHLGRAPEEGDGGRSRAGVTEIRGLPQGDPQRALAEVLGGRLEPGGVREPSNGWPPGHRGVEDRGRGPRLRSGFIRGDLRSSPPLTAAAGPALGLFWVRGDRRDPGGAAWRRPAKDAVGQPVYAALAMAEIGMAPAREWGCPWCACVSNQAGAATPVGLALSPGAAALLRRALLHLGETERTRARWPTRASPAR